MRRLSLAILSLLVLAAGPIQPDVLYVLRSGDFSSGRQALGQTPAGDPLYALYLDWGEGRYDTVYEQAHTREDLPSLLLAIDAALRGGRPRLADELVPRARKLLGKGTRAVLAGYVLDSLEARSRRGPAPTLPPLTYDDDAVANALVEVPLFAEQAAFWTRQGVAVDLPACAPGEDWGRMGLALQVDGARDRLLALRLRRAVADGKLSEAEAVAQLGARVEALQQQEAALKARPESIYLAPIQGTVAVSIANLELERIELSGGGSFQTVLERLPSISDQAVAGEVWVRFAEALYLYRPPNWRNGLDLLLPQLEKRLRAAPDRQPWMRLLLLRGHLRAEQGRAAEARQDLTEGLQILETSFPQKRPRAYELLARLQLEAGDAAGASSTLDRMHQMDTLATFPLAALAAGDPALTRASELQQRAEGLARQPGMDPGLVSSTRSEFYQTLTDLTSKDPGYSRLAVRPNNFTRLQPALADDVMVVQYFPSDDKLYLFIATRQNLTIRQVPLPRADLDARVRAVRRAIVQAQGPFQWDSPLGQQLAELGELLVGPLELRENLIVVPTGSLHTLPFACLGTRVNGKPAFLAERVTLAVAAKSSDLEVLRGPGAAGGGKTLVLADPDGSLPGARSEAAFLEKLFGFRAFVGADATRSRLDGSSNQVHLATHGFLDVENTARSYLLMADGKLTALDVSALDLHGTRCVVLSACQSALGQRDAEVGWDLTSLADAFGFAGSPTLIASLWKVSDTATLALFKNYYTALYRGRGPAEALRLAECILLNDPATSQPYLWAGFEALGDYR